MIRKKVMTEISEDKEISDFRCAHRRNVSRLIGSIEVSPVWSFFATLRESIAVCLAPPFETSFAYGPIFPTKMLALPALFSRMCEIFSISRFIRICLEIDRRSAMHAASPCSGNVTSGEISVFLIARGKGREETFQKLYWKLRTHSCLLLSFRLPTRSSSRESIFEISSQTSPATNFHWGFYRGTLTEIPDETSTFYFFNCEKIEKNNDNYR